MQAYEMSGANGKVNRLRRAALLAAAALAFAGCSTLAPTAPVSPPAATAMDVKLDAVARVAVATAYDPEFDALFPDLEAPREYVVNGVSFWTGRLAGEDVVLFKTGVSLVNASMNTQILLDRFNIAAIVVCGVAGGLDPDLSIGDVTVVERWGQYNETIYMRTTPSGTHPEYRFDQMDFPSFDFIKPSGVRIASATDTKPARRFWFDVDPGLLEIARQAAASVELEHCDAAGLCFENPPKIVVGGNGVTGSIFMDNARFRDYLHVTFEARVVEMETAAIGMVAYANTVPYIAFRSLSDVAGGGNATENEEYIFDELASVNTAAAVKSFLKVYNALK